MKLTENKVREIQKGWRWFEQFDLCADWLEMHAENAAIEKERALFERRLSAALVEQKEMRAELAALKEKLEEARQHAASQVAIQKAAEDEIAMLRQALPLVPEPEMGGSPSSWTTYNMQEMTDA